MKKTKWFERKDIAAVFAIAAFVVGFLSLDKGITGNMILNNNYPVNVTSLIGLLLVLCSAILAIYIIRK